MKTLLAAPLVAVGLAGCTGFNSFFDQVMAATAAICEVVPVATTIANAAQIGEDYAKVAQDICDALKAQEPLENNAPVEGFAVETP